MASKTSKSPAPKQPVLHEFCIVGEYRYLIRADRIYTIRKNRKIQTCKEQVEHFMKRSDNKCLEAMLPKAGEHVEDCEKICTDGQLIPEESLRARDGEASHMLHGNGDGVHYCIDLDRTEVVEEFERLKPTTTRKEHIEFFMKNADWVFDLQGNESFIDWVAKL